MALITCIECNKEHTDTIESCPHCGYKREIEQKITIDVSPKKKRHPAIALLVNIIDWISDIINWFFKLGCFPQILVIIGALFLIGICNGDNKSSNKRDKPKTEEERIVDNQFSSWNGSHYNLVEYVKDRLKDPSSFEHVETRYKIESNKIMLVMKYRGSNSFGAVVTETVSAEANKTTGRLISINGNPL